MLIQAHSILRYILLLVLLVVIVKSIWGWGGKKPYTKLDNKLSLYLLIFAHLQLVLGVVLYFVSDKVYFGAETMKNAGIRYFTVEHFAGMLAAIILITIGRSTSKRMVSDVSKHKRLAIINVIALLLIVAVLMTKGLLFT